MSRVIIASYDDEMRSMLKYSLDSNEYNVYTAYNIGSAMELFDEDDLNVLIYDLDNGGFPKQTIEEYCTNHHLLVILTGNDTSMAFKCFSDQIGEFIIKPDSFEDMFTYEFFEALEHRIGRYFDENRNASHKPQKSKIPTMPKASLINYNTTKLSADLEQEKVIVIGAAAGGGEAISEILTSLPKDMPPIAIVGTFPRNMTHSFIQRMNNYSKLLLKMCEGNEYMIPGTAYFAPEDTHIMINRYGKRLTIECGKGRKINGVRPSIDILFNSASEITKENAIGVLLTGNGVDGVKGLCNIKDKGGRTLCQDIDSCVAKEKVKMAKSLNASNKFVRLSEMSKVLQDMVLRD